MVFRATKNFRATSRSTIIAVLFTLLSGASTLAGGELLQPSLHGIAKNSASELWKGIEQDKSTEHSCTI
ncbi:MAG: hypothetical protein HOC23_09605 [Halieaceae bacterium]|jgi:hypothetical protein|nr:hypothetical protein [Halieaceae bacterium]